MDHPQRPLDVPQVPVRRVLRHDPGRWPGPAPAGKVRDVPQRPHADLLLLDGGTGEFSPGNDAVYAYYLPTYAAIAHYHGLHGDRPLRAVLDEAEDYAARDYLWALHRGSRLTGPERAAAVARVAALTGLTEDYVDRVDLRPEHIRFFTELLRARRQTVGRLDGRFTGWEADYGREHGPPTRRSRRSSARTPRRSTTTCAASWVPQRPAVRAADEPVQPWSYKEFEGAHLYVADKLAAAMRANPHMRVHVACGYHDGATPYFAAEHTFAHLAIPAQLRANVEFRYFEAGHMMYVHEPSRLEQSAQLGRFVTAAGSQRSNVTTDTGPAAWRPPREP